MSSTCKPDANETDVGCTVRHRWLLVGSRWRSPTGCWRSERGPISRGPPWAPPGSTPSLPEPPWPRWQRAAQLRWGAWLRGSGSRPLLASRSCIEWESLPGLSRGAELGVRSGLHLDLRTGRSGLLTHGACGIVDFADRVLVDTDGFAGAVSGCLTGAGFCVLVLGGKRDHTSCAGRALG